MIAGWDFSSQTTTAAASPLAATTAAANATVGGLARGSGLTATGIAGGYGGTGWDPASTTAAAAVTANDFLSFTVAANTGYTLSLSSVNPVDYRRSGTGPTSGTLQYQVGSGSFADITTFSYSSTSSSGAALASVDLTGISALQNIAAGTTVTFRLANYSASSSGGTFYLFNVNSGGNDFALNGTLSLVASSTLAWAGANGGTWDTSTASWAGSTTWTNGSTVAIFSNSANQALTVSSVTAGGVQFGVNGISLSGGTITDGNASSGLSAEVTNSSDTATVSTTLSGSNGLTKSGSGKLVLSGTQSSLSGTVTISSGTLQLNTATLANNNNITNSGTVEFAQSSTGTYSGTLTNNGNFTKSGVGNLTIANSVSGSGNTTISGGTITAGANNPVATGTLSMSSGTTLNLGNFTASAGGLSMTGAAVSNVGTLTLTGTTGAVTTNADSSASTISGGTLALGTGARTFTIADGAAASDLTISSNLSSSGAGVLIKVGAGTLTLAGTNSLAGTTGVRLGTQGASPVEGGTLAISDNNAVGNSSSTALQFNAGTLSVGSAITLPVTLSVGGRDNNGVSTPTITGSDLTISGAPSFFRATGTTGNLTLNVNNNTTLAGNFAATSGTGTALTGIVLGGTGNLTLTGTNSSLTDNLTVANTLTVKANSSSALGTGTVAINSGATVKGGAGTTIGNALTVNSGGTLSGTDATSVFSGTINGTGSLTGTMKLSGTIAPGNSPGQITNTSTLTFGSGAIYSWDLATLTTTYASNAFDQILNNTGGSILLTNLTITPNITASTPGNNSFWDTNHTWVIVDSSGGGTITGTALATTNNYSSNGTFSSALNGNNLELTWTASAIPEPSTYAAIFGAAALGCAVWRRRSQRKNVRAAAPLV